MLHFAYELYLPCLSAIMHSSYCLGFFPFCLFPFTFLPVNIMLGGSPRPNVWQMSLLQTLGIYESGTKVLRCQVKSVYAECVLRGLR